jgi:hypothetical protein
MFRKIGTRFSEWNMRKIKESRAHHDSNRDALFSNFRRGSATADAVRTNVDLRENS